MATKKTASASTATKSSPTTSVSADTEKGAKAAAGVTRASAGPRESPAGATRSAAAKKVQKDSGPTTKAVAKKSTTKPDAQKALAGKTEASKTVNKKTAVAAPAKQTATKKPAVAAPAKQTATKKAAVKKAAVKKTATSETLVRGADGSHRLSERLQVKDDESPWSAAEIEEMRSVLVAEIETHREEVRLAEEELDVLLRDSGDGAGSDEADAGTMTAERVHEIALANNAHASLEQAEHALEQLDAGTYGICDNCGGPIGKLRLQARPRATLCMPCQAKQDRH